MTKKNKICLVSGIILFVILAITFFFTDLNISKTFAQENPNFFFLLLASVGEFPIYIGPIMFGLVYGFTNESKNSRLFAHLVGLIATYIASIRLVDGVFETFFNSNLGTLQYALLALVALFFYIFLFILVNNVSKEKLVKLRDISLMYLIISIGSFLIVSGMKLLWGRPRYRVLFDNYENYNNFLQINFFDGTIGDDYRSFPSGHTNAASCIFLIPLVVKRFTSKKWIKYLSISLCFLYVLIMAISRICLGAHYASDVLFGFGINSICAILTYIIFKKKGWLYVRSDKC